MTARIRAGEHSLTVHGRHGRSAIELVDERGLHVAEATGTLFLELPEPGLYTIRVQRPTGAEERLVAVNGETHVSLAATPRAPLAELADGVPEPLMPRHAPSFGEASRVVVAAGTGVGHARMSFAADRRDLTLDATTGLAAVSALVDPCYATIEHDVPELGIRVQRMPVVRGWETQVFLAGRHDRGPRLKLYMRRAGRGFDPDDLADYGAVDSALEGLAHGEVALDDESRDALGDGTAISPLLAVIVGFAALRENDHEVARAAAALLARAMPDAPDTIVLENLLAGRTRPVTEPPLLAEATRRLLELSVDDASLAPEGTMLAELALRLRTADAWTRWDPRATITYRALERNVALARPRRKAGTQEIARVLELPPVLIPEPRFRAKLWAWWQRVRQRLRHAVALLPVELRVLPGRASQRLLAYERGPGTLERQPPRAPDQLLRGGAQVPGERSSRVSAAAAGWRTRETQWRRGAWEDRLAPLEARRWRDFSWFTRALLDFANHIVARQIRGLVDPERAHWMASQRAAGVLERFPVLIISRREAHRLVVLGNPGETDTSQYAIATALMEAEREAPSDLMVLLGDVIYPAGDVHDYVDGLYEAYREYRRPIFAIPGTHDWYDGLAAFMIHFCGAEQLPTTSYRRPGYTAPERIARWLWRHAGRPDRPQVKRHRDGHDSMHPNQPGPYWAMDVAGDVRLVGIDTGIDGTLDREQGEWLLQVSSAPGPKVLLTGKPIWVNGAYNPCRIAWGEQSGDKSPYDSVDDVVRDRRFGYVAVLGGDTHNYQRQSITVNDDDGERVLEYVVAGGSGADMSATHTIGLVGDASRDRPETPAGIQPARDEDFRCYPTRGDSLAYNARWYGSRLLTTAYVSAVALTASGLAFAGWQLRGDTPDPGLTPVMLAALAGAVGIPAAAAFITRVAHHSFPDRHRAPGAALALATLAAALGAAAVSEDRDWLWHAALIGFADLLVLVAPAILGYYVFASVARLRRRHVGLLLVGLLALDVGDMDPATAFLIPIALALIAVTAALWMLEERRARRGTSESFEHVRPTPWLYAPLVTAALLVGAAAVVPFWDVWAVRTAVAAALALVLACSLLVLVVVIAGGRRAVADLRRGALEPDRALGYLHDRGILETLPLASDYRRPARVRNFDYPTMRICELLLPGSRGPRRWVTAAVSGIGNANRPPMFKSFVTLDIGDGRLVLTCRGVTGRDLDGQAPPCEDRVVIPLPAG